MRIGLGGAHAIHIPPLCKKPMTSADARELIDFLARACRQPTSQLIKNATWPGCGAE